DHRAIRALLLDGVRYVVWLILPVQVGLWVLGRPFLGLWLGETYALQSYPCMAILAIPLTLIMAQTVASRILYGIGRLRLASVLAIGEAVANLLLSVLLVGPLGISGVAWGTAVPSAVSAVLIMAYTCRLYEISPGELLRQSFLRPLLAVLLPGAVWAATRT